MNCKKLAASNNLPKWTAHLHHSLYILYGENNSILQKNYFPPDWEHKLKKNIARHYNLYNNSLHCLTVPDSCDLWYELICITIMKRVTTVTSSLQPLATCGVGHVSRVRETMHGAMPLWLHSEDEDKIRNSAANRLIGAVVQSRR